MDMTVKQSALMMNVSERTVYRAKKLRASGRADLIQKVERGELTIHAALKEAGISETKTANWQTVKHTFLSLPEEQRQNFIDWIEHERYRNG